MILDWSESTHKIIGDPLESKEGFSMMSDFVKVDNLPGEYATVTGGTRIGVGEHLE